MSALLLAGLVSVPVAASANGVALSLSGPVVITSGTWGSLKVSWSVDGAKQSGPVDLEKKSGTTWKRARSYQVSNGTGTVRVKPKTSGTYRVRAGSTLSNPVTVKSSSYYISLNEHNLTMPRGSSASLTVKYVKRASIVPKGRLHLQHKVGGKWKTAYDVTIVNSRAKLTLKPGNTKSYRLMTTNGKLFSSVITVNVRSVAPKSFTIEGSGYGHGVGMPQYGAYQMAREGKSATQILQHFYKGSKVKTASTPKDIRVNVFGQPGDAERVNFKINQGTWRLRDSTGETLATGSKTEQVELSVQGENVVARAKNKTYSDTTLRLHWSGTRFYQPTGTSAVASLIKPTGAAATHGTYRNGRFTIKPVGGKPSIANDLLLNTEYLYGLSEMPSSWDSAALQAQVIVGRTYAIETKPTATYDILDSTVHQNYTGWNKENEGATGQYGKRWRAAVDATMSSEQSAQVLTDSAGNYLQAYYFSSSGGKTANSEDVCGTKLPWARGVDDKFSLNAPGNTMKSWKRTLTQAQAQQIFGLKEITSIKVTTKYSSGQMKKVTATSISGKTTSVTAKADKLRSAFGLPASWVKSFSAN